MSAEILHTIIVYRGWAKYLVASLRLPNGAVVRREIEDHGAAIAVLPYDPVRKVALLVRQVRAPVLFVAGEGELTEAIAGMVEQGKAEDSARREAHEEAGLALQALEPVGSMWTKPGCSTERMSLYLAAYAEEDRTGEGGGLADEQEHITLQEVALCDLAREADGGRMADMKTFALVQTLGLKRPEVFQA